MNFFLAKRFGLVQRAGKLRVIDDCSHRGHKCYSWVGGKVQGSCHG